VEQTQHAGRKQRHQEDSGNIRRPLPPRITLIGKYFETPHGHRLSYGIIVERNRPTWNAIELSQRLMFQTNAKRGASWSAAQSDEIAEIVELRSRFKVLNLS
jgi:hypothetical protein